MESRCSIIFGAQGKVKICGAPVHDLLFKNQEFQDGDSRAFN